MAEIRLDLTGFEGDILEKVFAHPTPTIATCRPGSMGTEKQQSLLIAAMHAGAGYVDIELEAPEDHIREITALAKKLDCKVIISYHNYTETPGLKELYKIADTCYALGADIAKLAVKAGNRSDAARLLSLYSMNKPMVALSMGSEGKITRILSPFLGAVFTFAAMDEGEATAPGQILYSEMKELLDLIEKKLK
jgi:3-dehydroquinate dehydratase-1